MFPPAHFNKSEAEQEGCSSGPSSAPDGSRGTCRLLAERHATPGCVSPWSACPQSLQSPLPYTTSWLPQL